MQLVAASKMRKAQERMETLAHMLDRILEVIGHLACANRNTIICTWTSAK